VDLALLKEIMINSSKKIYVQGENMVQFVSDGNDPLYSVSFTAETQKNYGVSLLPSTIKNTFLKKFIESVKKAFSEVEEYNFNSGPFKKMIIKNSKILLNLDIQETSAEKGIFSVTPSAVSFKDLEVISSIIKDFEDDMSESEVVIDYLYYNANGKLNNQTTYKKVQDINSTDDYYPYLDTEELFTQYIMSENSIMLLAGIAGTGKTALSDLYLKFLLKSEIFREITEETDPMDIRVAYVKNEKILSDDQFWITLQDGGYDLVLLDDLDYSLLPRTQDISTQEDIDKNKFISNLLSFTDGIFDSKQNTKFIITTNKEVGEIDSAILRKGRTFDILNLRTLHASEARKIWELEGLDLKAFEEHFGHKKDILACDLGSEISEIKASLRFNRERKPYILEEGISLYTQYKTPKKLGF